MAEEDRRTVREESATVREAGGAATVRDAGIAGTPGDATVRDDQADAPEASAASQAAAAGGWLPPSVAESYRIVKALPAQGAEADIYVVESLSVPDARQRIAKVYRQGQDPNEAALEKIREADPRHVVQVEAFGQDAATGRWWEIQEYVEHGSLRNLIEREGPALPADLVMAILRELNDALGKVHELEMEHRDLKPSNVLVRSYDPLDLVLIDFGISSVMSATVHFTTASRTPRYAPPEAISGSFEHTTWDYWSLGMMLVELLTGKHPFDDAREAMIANRLATAKNFDEFVEGVSDPNWRKLCRGLLRREPTDRWDSEAISKWIANPEDPSLEVLEDAPPTGAPANGRTIDFDGASYTSSADLGAALARDWDNAASFWHRRGGDVKKWLYDTLGEQALGDAVAKIDDADIHPDVQVLSIISILAPDEPARYQDQELSLKALGELCRQALGGDDNAIGRLEGLYREEILDFAGPCPGREDLTRLWSRWKEAVSASGLTAPTATGLQLSLLLAANIDSACLLEPDRPLGLRFEGQQLSCQAVGELGRQAVGGDAEADRRLTILYRQRILRLAGDLPGHADLGRLSDLWEEAVMEYESTRQELDSEGTVVPQATDSELRLLLAASADSALADQLRTEAHGARTETALLCPWFKDFGEPEDMSVATLVMIPHVQAAAERWNKDAKSQQRRAWVGGAIVGAFWGLVVDWADRGWGIYHSIDGIGSHSFAGLIQCALVLFAFRWCRAWYWGWNDKLLYTFCLGPPIELGNYADSRPIGYGGGISWPWAIGGLITFLLVTQILVNVANVLTVPSMFLMRMLEWLVETALFAGEPQYGSLGESVHVVLNATIGALVGYMVGVWGLRRRRSVAAGGMGAGPDMGRKTSRWAIPIPASMHDNLRLVQARVQAATRFHPWQSLVVVVSAFVVLALAFSLLG